MVESFSKKCEKSSTILFFCKKMGKSFDCFLQSTDVSIKITKGTGKNKKKKVWRNERWEMYF